MIHYAEDQVINQDILTGSYNYNFQNSDDGILYYCTVSWVSTPEYEMQIDIVTIEAPEPLN